EGFCEGFLQVCNVLVWAGSRRGFPGHRRREGRRRWCSPCRRSSGGSAGRGEEVGRKRRSDMEKLISLVPGDLRRAIEESGLEDIDNTCGSLLDFLLPSPQFQEVVRELTDPEMGLCNKSRGAALDLKKKGNDCFVGGDFAKALSFYSQALRFAPVSSEDVDKNLLATLYVNRASAMHKLDFLEECKRDCARALLLSPLYVKAWYRRGKANLSLKNYKDAVHDLEVALNMESSSSGKDHIKEDLEIAINYSKSIDVESNLSSCNKDDNIDFSYLGPSNNAIDLHKIELQCVSIQAKGKGMVSLKNIPPAFLIHSEDPLAAVLLPIVLKNCRETHCHFCLNDLPTDVLFCSSCTIPFYCSEQCQEKATEGQCEGNLKGIPEHRHECGGVNWPAVLPSDVVLVGRVMAKFIEKKGNSPRTNTPVENLLVIVISQMKVNSMAVIHMKSLQQDETVSAVDNVLTHSIEQLRVGQAIYLSGRLFNHSCQPNIHAYFLSRKLLLRSTEFVPAGFPLELSYGPQVGQWGFEDRQKLLEDQYFFKCECSGCSELNLSDLVIHSFQCVKPTCFGAVLENHTINNGKAGETSANSTTAICSLELPWRVSSEKKDIIDEVAHLLLERPAEMLQICPGYCLCCSLRRDLKSSISVAETAFNTMSSKKYPALVLTDALKSFGQLKSVRHAYSKDVAQAEDIVAQAFCLMGDFEHALEHCKISIMILEKLYHDNHIVIGNELVKLASLQLSLGDHVSALRSVDRLEAIFSLYYGPHADLGSIWSDSTSNHDLEVFKVTACSQDRAKHSPLGVLLTRRRINEETSQLPSSGRNMGTMAEPSLE
ncbi:hypothetical protein Taro_016678, partial [Colocasia esculenta]|nr:hypothetical protein [Colocasia esculenta]